MINSHARRAINMQSALIIAFALAAQSFAPRSLAAPLPATVSISISKFAFEPKEITVTPGTKILWTNHDETPHTVTSTDKSFISKGLDTGDTFEYTFAKEGDFDYYCAVHPYMKGAVHVRKPKAP